jgi:hypothetical protein
MKIATFTLGILMLVTLGLSVSAAPCKIAQSVYRDADGKGFELVFSAGNRTSQATATITYPPQGQLYQFNVVQSSGYGSIFLVNINDTRNRLETNSRLGINFFDQNLRAATPIFSGEETIAPEYAFISELGGYDYYQRRGSIQENTPPLLADLMWVHDRCQ